MPPGQRDNAGLNAKLQYDVAATLQAQMLADNQANARSWNALALKIAQDAAEASSRRSTNAGSFDHATSMNAVPEAQTGTTEGQQTTSPIRTVSGDAIAGAAGVSAAQIAANIANFTTAISAAVMQLYAAMVAVNVTAAGRRQHSIANATETGSLTPPLPPFERSVGLRNRTGAREGPHFVSRG